MNFLPNKQIKIAFLSNFTSRGFAEAFMAKCLPLGVEANVYTAPYNQYRQEILNDQSGLYKFNPEVVILFIDTRTLLGDYYFNPYVLADAERELWVEEKVAEIGSLAEKMLGQLSTKIIINNFELPAHSPLGVLENKQSFGFIESIEALNRRLRDIYKNNHNVFVFDFNAFSARVGKQNIFDDKFYYLADLKIALPFIPQLVDAYLGYIKPLTLGAKKCLVLDLDNTLWGGVIGEDGLSGITLGPTPQGRPYLEFQKHLLALQARGVILAINSKNNYQEAIAVLRDHPEMVLREQHFSALKINWNDKASNLRAISQELNIGLDSLVFFDDDAANRELVKNQLPEVTVVEVPLDPALYSRTLLGGDWFNSLQFTAEDKDKGKMYAAERVRAQEFNAAGSVDDYLRGLEMEVELDTINTWQVPRMAQLAQKTNQFNLTTRRYLEDDIIRWQKDHLVVTARVSDKFGDSGLTGLAIVEKGDKEWRIDNFLLSCRVIGRKVEETILAFIIKEAQAAGAPKLKGEFIKTPKNAPAQDFYKNSGFALVAQEGDAEIWHFDPQLGFAYPDIIKVKINAAYV